MSRATIHAAAKDWPVTILWKDTKRGKTGGVEEIWDPPLKAVPMKASRKDMHGGEDFEASQKVGHGKTSWRIWFRDDVTAADCRVRDDRSGQEYEVNSVRMIGRRQELEMMTEIKDNEK